MKKTAEIAETEIGKWKENNEFKSWFSEINSKIDKILARVKKRRKAGRKERKKEGRQNTNHVMNER